MIKIFKTKREAIQALDGLGACVYIVDYKNGYAIMSGTSKAPKYLMVTGVIK